MLRVGRPDERGARTWDQTDYQDLLGVDTFGLDGSVVKIDDKGQPFRLGDARSVTVGSDVAADLAVCRSQQFVPTAEGFGVAVRAGQGRAGLFPDGLAGSHLGDGSFVRVSEVHLDVPLYWQCWKLNSPLVQTR